MCYLAQYSAKVLPTHIITFWKCLSRKPDVVAEAFNLNTREAEAGESVWIWGQPGLYNEFRMAGFIYVYLIKNNTTPGKVAQPLITAPPKLKQVEFCEFEASYNWSI